MIVTALFHCLSLWARRCALPAALVLATVPACAESTDALALEQRVERLLWQLVNDERYGHLQIAANYERLRARLLEEACLVSAAPCMHEDKIMHEGRAMTTEITPEQVELVEQLLFTVHSASASSVDAPTHLLISASE